MAQELSSNWKRLQARIKAEPSKPASSSNSTASPSKPVAKKRKAETNGITAPSSSGPKRQKVDKPTAGGAKSQSKPSKDFKSTPRHNPKPTTTTKTGASKMGVTQSSAVTRGTSATITPSLALWAEDNDISAEDLAEAYNLGVPKTNNNNSGLSSSRTIAASKVLTQEEDETRANEGLAPSNVIASLGRYVAIDCEMVGVGPEGRDSVLARVSMVDFHGRQVYDSLVRPREHVAVTDWRTAITGLTPRSMRQAREFEVVQREVADLLLLSSGGGDGARGRGRDRGRVIVGHDVRHDLAALELSHPAAQIRDTARFSGYRKYGHGPKPALRVLAREVLGVEIQGGHHSSLEDARVAMLLFRIKKPEFDVEHANKFGKMLARGGGGGRVGDGDEGDEDGERKAKAKAKAQGKKKKKKKKH